MKKTLLILTFIVLTFSTFCQIARIYPFKKTFITELKSSGPNEFSTKDSSVYFGASASFDVFQKERLTGDYKIGILPGLGYGIKYNPFLWQGSYLIALDLFAQADLNSVNNINYFNIDFIPVLSFLNWVKIGLGPEWIVGLNGNRNKFTTIFVIGITKQL